VNSRRNLVLAGLIGIAVGMCIPIEKANADGGFYADVHWVAVSLDRIAKAVEKK